MFTVERIGANKGSVAGGRRPTLHILPFFTECFFPPLSAELTKTDKSGKNMILQEKNGKRRTETEENGWRRIFFIYISSCYGKDDGSILSYTEISACY